MFGARKEHKTFFTTALHASFHIQGSRLTFAWNIINISTAAFVIGKQLITGEYVDEIYERLRVTLMGVTAGRNLTPKQSAGDCIETLLAASGWVILNKNKNGFGAGQEVAIRTYPIDAGPSDDVPLVVSNTVEGEAKRPDEGESLMHVADQCGENATAKLKWMNNNKQLPFLYENASVSHLFEE